MDEIVNLGELVGDEVDTPETILCQSNSIFTVGVHWAYPVSL